MRDATNHEMVNFPRKNLFYAISMTRFFYRIQNVDFLNIYTLTLVLPNGNQFLNKYCTMERDPKNNLAPVKRLQANIRAIQLRADARKIARKKVADLCSILRCY